uniref:Sugar fermentation stimulation protein A n=1 Tax=Candidatus Methanophaga sp. ANME-1 ERB7 TaxID=2759913 RepID=A0A7G9ZC39_9EURY|nr:sugar fermentation stimulation protein A [Methanosarcinales archaeon ANME-1 ERB7]
MKNFPINLDQAVKAVFLERPNRFLVRCIADGLGIINAYLPNPGRLWELLLPGATLYLYPDTP